MFYSIFGKEINSSQYLKLSLFSLLPISMILGNMVLNINILLIDIILLYYCVINNYWSWLKSKLFIILITLYSYLIINSLIAYQNEPSFGPEGIIRSLGFIKFIIFSFSFQILINEKELSLILRNWLIVILIIIFDIFFEKYFGHNVLGFTSLDGTRIISFFYDESIVGGFVLCFGFISCCYFFKFNNEKKKIFLNIVLLLLPLSIFITGERANFLKSFFLFSLIIIFINSSFLIIGKKKFFLILITLFVIGISFSKTIFIKQTEFFERIFVVQEAENFTQRFQKIKYFAHFNVAWEIFKENPIIGVGSKNFRHECGKEKYFNSEITLTVQRCNTHPHQIHFELLAEQGLIGYLITISLLLYFVKNNLSKNLKKNSIFNLSLNLYILIFFLPFLPGGGIFSTLSGFLFWLPFSLANINKYQI